MVSGFHNQEKMPDNLKKQLALAVKSIQWSYAIFWSPSITQPGVLEWGDGYYNGNIKTRKTVRSSEVNANQLDLQRSEQLRELYESLSAGELNQQAIRPSAALSPEDLSDMEWYYLVCMSFEFDIGQGLPGRALAEDRPIWLSNAHYADIKVFGRSLLAKSASIQTVVCYPFLRGVVELGVTELVLEDPNLIRQVEMTMLEIPCPVVVKNYSSKENKNLHFADFDVEVIDAKSIAALDCEESVIASPNNRSNNQPGVDSFTVERQNGGTSTIQNWQLMNDKFSNCSHHSLNFGDFKSSTVVDPAEVHISKNSKVNDEPRQEIREGNHSKPTGMHLQSDDLHYKGVLSSVLKTSDPLILNMHFQKESSFISWRKVESVHYQENGKSPQKLLKKILFEVPCMHGAITRETLNERFMILKSVVPSIRQVDKVSILDDMIEYLQKLERRIEELEARRGQKDLEARTKRKLQDTVERISGNRNGKRPSMKKRKAHGIDKTKPEFDDHLSRDNSADNVRINIDDNDLLIEIRCQWREGILLEILNAVSHLQLDAHSVQSSNVDGILCVTIKSKNKIVNAASTGSIKQELHRVAWRC